MEKNEGENFLTQKYLNRIEELENVLSQMRKRENETEILSLPWVGNLGQWYWMVESNQVEFNEKKITNLGYETSDLPEKVGFDFFTSKLHPDDYKRVMDNMRKHLMNLSEAYEVEYRIKAKNGEYVWYYDRGKVTKRDENGKPLIVAGIVFDISKSKAIEIELKKANEELQRLVITDDSTGAYNKRYFLEKINEEINNYNRSKSKFSLIMFDIDKFKQVNDNFGHSMGDVILKRIVEISQENIRKDDIFCRWGGEEFFIVLPNTEKENAIVLAEKLRSNFSNYNFPKVGKVTASFGVACYGEDDVMDKIIKRADDLMYKAKSEGRNCVRY